MKTKSIRILLVDDHAVLRAGLRLLLGTQPEIEVVGEAENGEDGLRLVRETRPDLVLMDLSMSGVGGVETLRRIHQEMPWVKVLVLTMHDDPEYLREALRAGAAGYVVKRAADSELMNAIRAVQRGEKYVYPTLASRALLAADEGRWGTAAGRPPEGGLSQRETEVLQLVVLGYTNQELATQLSVGVRTVETYKARIMEKLSLSTRAELVRYAIRHNLVQIS